MTEKNVPEELKIDMASDELKNLIHYWDSLSCWERDQSIDTVEELLGETDASSVIASTHIGKMREQVTALKSSNHIDKQSKFKFALTEKQRINERKKSNYQQSMEIIRSLSRTELMELGEYMGLNPAKLSLMKIADLHKMYDEILTCKSIAVFFACRNYIGKTYM
ncbi:hypothetical protein [Methanolobus sp.]|uniref:hypothetical protein n=1 Tax=Methanolobus sp. TaxID=1874737 RepID=UPI0025DC5C68|nr:hypothetical protein [Methanolobus sp.]